MGLDVTAYEAVHLIPDHLPGPGWCEVHSAHFIDDGTDGEPGGQCFVYVGHELTAGGLQLLDDTSADCHFGLCYTATGSTDSAHWSYGGYHQFRKVLCLAANGVPIEKVWSDPGEWRFALLLNFADNEGWIGPKAAELLATEFDRYADEVLPKLTDEWHAESYRIWQRLTGLVRGTGAVVFH